MALGQSGHRSGPLKQTNKSHKTGRHRSKGAIDNELKGNFFFHSNLKKSYFSHSISQEKYQ